MLKEKQILGWTFVKSEAPFLGFFSPGNSIEWRHSSSNLLIFEKLKSQLWSVGLLLSFGIYLTYVLVFHFNEVNGGYFGISLLALGGMVGIGFGTKSAVRLFRAPAVEFDFMKQSICFLSRNRNRRILHRTILFIEIASIGIRKTMIGDQESATDLFILELNLLSPSGERLPICVSGNRQKLVEIVEILASKTRLRVMV